MPTTERLVEVRRGIRACTHCELRSEATAPVPPRGPSSADMLVVGEAPGRTEDGSGRPFTGAAGNLLSHLLREAGIEPADLAYANACCCFPSVSKTPKSSHVQACNLNLHAALSAWAPSIILTVGKTALSAFRPDLYSDLKLVHGRPMIYNGTRLPADGGGAHAAILYPTYHPAAALPGRSPKYREIIAEDLAILVSRERDGKGRWPDDCTVCGRHAEWYDDWGLSFCRLHADLQGTLFETK